MNYAISSGGGGGGTTPGKRQLSIRKYDPVNQIGVAGAELTVYSVDGSLYLKGITDESGYLIFTMPTDGTYTYQETEAPAGYYLNPTVQYLYIKDGKVTNPENRTLYDYPNVEVILEKKDSEDGTAVPDTLLQVTDPDGQVVFHGRTDETGECKVLAVSWRSSRQTDMSGPKHHGSSLFHMTEPSLGKQHFIMKKLIKRLVSGGSMRIMRARMEAADPMDWVFQTG